MLKILADVDGAELKTSDVVAVELRNLDGTTSTVTGRVHRLETGGGATMVTVTLSDGNRVQVQSPSTPITVIDP
jgi:hypothetical protein